MKRRDDDAFGRQLREAAAAVTPDASEPLHARVMADVRRARAIASSSDASSSLAPARWGWLIGAAVVIAIGVGVWLTTSREPVAPPAPYAKDVAPLKVPSFEVAVAQKIKPVRAKLHEARFAYLDRDTKRLAQFLIRSVPGVPAKARTTNRNSATPSSASGT
jgi:hypothetical protein